MLIIVFDKKFVKYKKYSSNLVNKQKLMKNFTKNFQNIVAVLFSNAELGEIMKSVFALLTPYFPLEAFTFNQFDPKNRALHIMFVTTAERFHPTRVSVPLSVAGSTFVTRFEASHNITLMDDALTTIAAHSHAHVLTQFFPPSSRAYLATPLAVDGDILGHLVFVGTAPRCFTRKHEQLLSLLVGPFALFLSNILKTRDIAAEKEKIAEEKSLLAKKTKFLANNILVGAGSGLKKVVEAVQQLEHMESPVLLLGETGTGKELVAAAIQKSSRRQNAPFVKINCGAIPESLLNSELFGHEKGAFTGASGTGVGRFEQAHGGTLFLDEVGELSLQAQVHLLRVLQDGIIQRIGGTRSIRVDVRIIAATNRDLAAMRHQGLFREDLFHRLHVFPISVPPLRERRDDIPLLMKHFISKTSARLGLTEPKLYTKSLPSLMNYSWPGNVRELENLVERAFILNPAGPLDLAQFLPTSLRDLPSPALIDDDPQLLALIDQRITKALESLRLPLAPVAMPLPIAADAASNAPQSLEESTRRLIEAALRQCHGKVYGPAGAAACLNINHNTLRARMKKLGIAAKQFYPEKAEKNGWHKLACLDSC